MARGAAVAGAFYEGDREALVRSIEGCFAGRLGPGRLPSGGVGEGESGKREGRVVGLVCPHAGYMFSGCAAAYSYDALARDGAPDLAVILGPNHRGLGEPVAVSTEDAWTTPLGAVPVDQEVASAILERSHFARPDELAHMAEHSIEVQLPFLQYLSVLRRVGEGESGRGGDRPGRISIVPIAIAHMSESTARALVGDLGPAIASSLAGRSAVVIASTDFTHYESKTSAQSKDKLALDRITALDPEGLLRVVEERSISMCGATGTAVMLAASKELGARSARVLTYYTSGDVTGETAQVVGYAGLSIGNLEMAQAQTSRA